MIMESLDDEIGLRHYQSRLLSSTFGSWVTWLLSEKANTAQNMATATSFSSHRQLATVLFRLQSNVNVANETQYRLFLGLTMSRFLQKRRGLHSLGHFVCRSKVVRDEDHHYRIDDFTWNHSRMIQLYKRLRNRAFRRMQLTSAANDALRIPSSRRARWGGQAMQQWVTVTVKSIQDRILMRKAAVKSKNAARLKYMSKHCIGTLYCVNIAYLVHRVNYVKTSGKWLLCCCQRREDRKLESDCNEVYYYVHLCRRVLRRFVCLVQDRRTRLQMVAVSCK